MITSLDVLVVGGGPVGAAVGALLARASRGGTALRVGLLQAAEMPADGRVIALSRASESILDAAGAWPALQAHAWAYEHMRVWHHTAAVESDEVLQFDAAQVGEPNLGYIIETRKVTSALIDSFVAAGGELLHGELKTVTPAGSPTAALLVHSSAGDLSALLVVGADGARSAVRTAFGIEARAASYEQTALVARVIPEVSHRNTAWQRFIEGGTLALLPLADGSVSIVWSVREARGRTLLSAASSEFEAQLLQESDGVLGRLTLAGARLTFPLQRLSADRYTAERCALVGDAAHVVHPLAGQGVNLGLLDAAALAQLTVQARASGEFVGAQRTLRAYERWRKGENQLMEFAIDAFNRVLAQGVGPVSLLARRALALTNRSALLKRFFIGQALGQAPALTAWESGRSSLRR
ncbi:MAG TPA: FAD-dependent monooxygenase [Steroidobacteraceae bacterium]|nr:FAD-dependent monooxygenase [Steroidobacteraceae bacterium]